MPSDLTAVQKLGIVRNNLQMFGLWRTLGDVLGYLFTGAPRDRFDRKYGVATAGVVEKAEAGVDDPAALADAIRYVPIREQVLRHVLTHATRVVGPRNVAFVDLGCGKGRALIMASWFAFRSILGVELSPRHAAIAERNATGHLARPRGPELACRDISVACGNALHCDLPAGDLLVFMYRPFKGQVFQGVLDRLHDHARRTGCRVVIAYVCPVERAMLERHAGFRKLAEFQVIVDEHHWSLWECRPALPDRGQATPSG
jgi:SAM-dependent methyltransferase